MDLKHVKEFLDDQAEAFNGPHFIPDDPVSLVHMFDSRQNQEISGLLSATISWGNRVSILRSGKRMLELLDFQPYEFVKHASVRDFNQVRKSGFVHRTFQSDDLVFFLRALREIYQEHSSLEEIFLQGFESSHDGKDALYAIHHFRRKMLSVSHQDRQRKHLSDPLNGSAGKRINMFLRWMVRRDKNGVDLGIWDKCNPAWLSIPLDVHSGNVAREIGLLKRKSNDATAVRELDEVLRKMDPVDPVRYDFALFGLGVSRKKSGFNQV